MTNSVEFTSEGAKPLWIAARTRSRYEKLVSKQLTSRGIENFLPLVRHKRRNGPRDFVLIPGYVFVQTTDTLPVLTVIGVCGIVTFQSRPAYITDEEITMLREAIKPDYRAKEHSGFSLRQAVRIVGTAFDGHVGTIDCFMGSRVRVIIPLSIGKSFSIELECENVEPVASHGIIAPTMTEIPGSVH